MAKNKDDAQGAPWPIPTFHFIVDFDGTPVAFQEVSGLDTEYDVIEYRNGNSPEFSTVKMPGLKKYSDVTIKKGIFKDDTSLFEYFASVKMNTVARKTITVSLVDENGSILFVWTLKNAFPKKVTGASMNAKTSDVAIEEIVLAHEGLTMAKVG
ncbi:MAG: phage tail protein [Lewinellaceae bacterium]|nr:phage tail protein [Lewinellaceae bacterium]